MNVHISQTPVHNAMKKSLRPPALVLSLCVTTSAFAADPIDYPDGYRQWTHVKSMTIQPGHPLENPFLGIHHIYANRKALAGLKAGRYEDGASFVFDQLAYESRDKASIEGARVLLGVMVKDRARFPATGGWGYEGWAGDSRTERLVSDGGVSCHGCHSQMRDRDFVFTQWRR